MILRPDQLTQQLQTKLAPFYLLSGDEHLLLDEARLEIIQAAKQLGIDEHQRFYAEGTFKWTELLDEQATLSLFASRRILEVRVPSGKPSDSGKVIMQLTQAPNDDTIFIFIFPKIDKRTQQTKWFKALEQAGIYLAIWPIERQQFPNWLKRRIQQAGLSIEANALDAFIAHTEGNLLACVQEIEKLKLSGISHIDEQSVLNSMGDSARFNVFALSEACLKGDNADSLNILSHLHAEGIEALSILGILTRSLRHLLELKSCHNKQLASAFKRLHIWSKQQALYRQALSRLSEQNLQQALQLAQQIDVACKGGEDDPWLLLSQLCALLCTQRHILHSVGV